MWAIQVQSCGEAKQKEQNAGDYSSLFNSKRGVMKLVPVDPNNDFQQSLERSI